MDFFSDHPVLFALICAGVAIAYGIGLTVCKTVVERHGGRIWIEPAAGGGARFQFTLPASRS